MPNKIGPKTGIRGFGTGKGKKKGSSNKIPHKVKQHIAGIVAGSVDETTLKMLAATHPKVYAELIKHPNMTRILKNKKLMPKVSKPKPKLAKEDTVTDLQLIRAELEKEHAGAPYLDEMFNFMVERLGPHGVKERASHLRLAMMTPEQKRQYWTDRLIEAKTAKATGTRRKPKQTQRTYRGDSLA